MSQLSKAASEAIVKGMQRPMLIDGVELDKLRHDREELLEALKAMDREIMDLALYIDLENKVAAHACLDAIRAIQEAAIRKAEEQA